MFKVRCKLNTWPDDPDSDGDGYEDNIEKNMYNSDPMKSDVLKIRWDQDYIYIEGAPDSEYEKDGLKLGYGGNQSWKANSKIANPNLGEISDFELILSKVGCGVVSAGDLLLYLAETRPEFATSITNSVRHTENGYIEYESYIEYLKRIEEFIPMEGMIKDDKVTGGVSTINYYSGLNYYAYINETNLCAGWNNSKELLLPRIKTMLQNDIPVPLLIGDGSKNDGVSLYREVGPAGSQRYVLQKYIQKTCWHYVNITGLLEDHIDGKTILEISSWGERLYISYEDYVDYVERRSSVGYHANNICYIEMR